MSKLQEYAQKRRFDRTKEPPPLGAARSGQGPPRFVVQAHAARAMHYDFRLQVQDVLVSWAVPKGPSLDPKERRLAVKTEDHPLEYAQFEGIIPKGEYGGGSVIVWDEGTWVPEGDAQEGLEKGKLTFTLKGKKLRGRFHLTRTRDRSRKNARSNGSSSWLLIKGRDEAARGGQPSIVEEAPQSVLSGRTLEEVREAPSAIWHSNQGKDEVAKRAVPLAPSALTGARRAPFPTKRQPQLATLVSRPPGGDDFLHEAKLDGYRLLSDVRQTSNGPKVRLWTRGNQEWSERFPALAQHLATLPLGDVLLDGEVVAFDEKGLTRFQLLQNAIGTDKQAQLVYVVFDLIHQDGYDLSSVPLIERKAALKQLLASSGAHPGSVRLSEHVVGEGPEFFSQACDLGMEGVVSKRVDAPYRGQRSRAWLKCKCLKRQEVVIGGYTEPSGSRTGLGALLVGLHDETGKLHFAGKVGTGFSARSLLQLQDRLAKLERKTSPFVDPPRGARARGVHWVNPTLLAEVAFSEMTHEGKLRHASFQGLREDKKAERIQADFPAETDTRTPSSAPASHEPSQGLSPQNSSPKNRSSLRLPIPLTHPERVLYPEQQLTKQALAEYYMSVSDWMLPYVRDRLLTLVRCPSGQGKPCFYQKHAKQGLPPSIFTHPVGEERELYVYVTDAAGLVGLVQIGVLEVHPWCSRIEHLKKPDQLVFDLDPDPDLEWARLVEGALDVKDELGRLGLQSFVKTTGGKGLHVTVPIVPKSHFDEAKTFCKAIAESLVQRHPSRYVATMTKSKRKGKIFIDYLRNAWEATAVAPYSTRARPGAPIATPLAWDELAKDVRSAFTPSSVQERLASLKTDPWDGFFEMDQTISERAKRELHL